MSETEMRQGMTPDRAKALREVFPPSAVGKLPKSTCRDCSQSPRKRCDRHSWVSNCPECRGSHSAATIHLDYVGHAAVTDRLLAVDPEWSWEPFAIGTDGLPALDRANNLWIRLTLCGVTRVGVGDGKSAKECIGDAIRNAAMRFGVALDLWAKEDLHEIHAAQGEPTDRPAERVTSTPPDDPWQDAAPRDPGERQVSTEQLKKIGAQMRDLGMTDRDLALAYVKDVIGREVGSRNDLTRAEAHAVIEALIKDAEQPFPTGEEAKA